MQKPDLLRPTLIGGAVFGLASSIPGVNLGNCCCCLWLFAAGWLATLLYARAGRTTGYAIKPSDGALVGLIAGLFGGFVSSIIETLLRVMFGDRLREIALAWLDNANLPPEMQDSFQLFRQALEQDQGAIESIVGLIVSLLGNLFFFALFSTIAGLLTALFLSRGSGSGAPPEVSGVGPTMPPPGGWTPPPVEPQTTGRRFNVGPELPEAAPATPFEPPPASSAPPGEVGGTASEGEGATGAGPGTPTGPEGGWRDPNSGDRGA